MRWLSGDHAVSARHLKVFCSKRRTSDEPGEGDAGWWVTRDSRNENTPLTLSIMISPTSTIPDRAASCTCPCLRRNGLAGSFFSTRADRSRLILSSVSVGSDGSRSIISMPESCSSGRSCPVCSELLMYFMKAFQDILFVLSWSYFISFANSLLVVTYSNKFGSSIIQRWAYWLFLC